MSNEFSDDPELAALLRSATPEAPAHEVDWNRLHGVIASRAELPLAALRRPGSPARRARSWFPLGLAGIAAASLAIALRPAPAPRTLPLEERRVVDAIVAESLPSNVDQMISGDAAEGALLAALGS
jgi:hypothetical protein